MDPVGVAFGALAITGLFKSCVENFDIVVRARSFSEEFDLLCTLVWHFANSIGLVLSDAFKSFLYSRYACFFGDSPWV
jgi:hypothetical protein